MNSDGDYDGVMLPDWSFRLRAIRPRSRGAGGVPDKYAFEAQIRRNVQRFCMRAAAGLPLFPKRRPR
jgi:hypothetical protein